MEDPFARPLDLMKSRPHPAFVHTLQTMPARAALAATLFAAGAAGAQAQAPAPPLPDPPKAVIAVVGDAERLNIGQGDYCSPRTEIPNPSNARFRVPAGKKTFLYIKSKFTAPLATYHCSGDFSFTPEASKLHILRFTMDGGSCQIELFSGDPGATPERAPINDEPTRACLGQ